MNYTPTPIHLALVDAHLMIRQGIRAILLQHGSFSVTIEAGNGDDLIEKLNSSEDSLPDICILDINIPGKNGWDTFHEIRARWPVMKVLFLTQLNNNDVIYKAVTIGANGYLPKNFNASDLYESLIMIHQTGFHFPEILSSRILPSFYIKRKAQLSRKELEFLSHCCNDDSYKEIAEKMCVSPRTIDGYRDSLFEKLNIKTRVGLAIYAIRNGLVDVFEPK